MTLDEGAASARDRGHLSHVTRSSAVARSRSPLAGAPPVWSAGILARLALASGAPIPPTLHSHGAPSVEARAELPQC